MTELLEEDPSKGRAGEDKGEEEEQDDDEI
jgi:hypothetical protein